MNDFSIVSEANRDAEMIAAEERAALPAVVLRNRPVATDVLIAACFFIGAAIWGTQFMIRWGMAATSYYQEYFGAAVTQACGGGFLNPNANESKVLSDFLAQRRDDCPCSAIAQVRTRVRATAFQRIHRYLMSSVAAVWRLRGVSRSKLAPFFGLLFAIVVASGYGILRLITGRPLAVLGAIALSVSSANLGVLPMLRDYAKAPFFLIALFCVTAAVIKPLGFGRTMLLAAGCGLATGIGCGFRADVLVMVPAAIVSFALFLPGKLRQTPFLRIAATLVFLVSFMIPAAPILRAIREESAGAHAFLLGLASPFNDALGLTTPYYDTVRFHSDTHVKALVNDYSYWKSRNTKPLAIISPEYAMYSTQLFDSVVRTFPADVVVRGLAAVRRLLDTPMYGMIPHMYLDPAANSLAVMRPPLLNKYLKYHSAVGRLFGGIGLPCAIAALCIIAIQSVRLALFYLFGVVYFGGYTALQFSLRHYFHLEILGLISILMVISAVSGLIVAAWRERSDPLRLMARFSRRAALRPLIVCGVFLIATVASLAVLRAYQSQRVLDLTQRYQSARRTVIPTFTTAGQSGRTLISSTEWEQPTVGRFRSEYLAVDIVGVHATFPFVVRYKPAALAQWDQSQVIPIVCPWSKDDEYGNDVTRLYIPTYSGPEVQFLGFEVDPQYVSSIRNVTRIDPDAQLPMPLFLTLYPDWDQRPQYQTFITRGRASVAMSVWDVGQLPPITRRFTTNNVQKRAAGQWGDDGKFRLDEVTVAGNAILIFRPIQAHRGDYIVAEGRLSYGCFETVVNNLRVSMFVVTNQPGRFRQAIWIPKDGMYTTVLVSGCRGPNEFIVDNMGLAETPSKPALAE